MKHKFLKRTISALLILCMFVGLLPAVSQQAQAETTDTTATAAEDSVATQTADLLSELTPLFNGLLIPVAQHQNMSLIESGGTYFMVAASGPLQNGTGYAIDYNQAASTGALRLTANTPNNEAASSFNHLYSIQATVSNWQLTGIDGSYPQNLDQAVQVVSNSTTVSYSSNSVTISGTTYTGWDAYINWEYNRNNSWIPSYYGNFGRRAYIESTPTRSDSAWNIKSLNPSRASAPWLSSNWTNNLFYSSSPYPFFFKKSLTQSGETFTANEQAFKIYRVNPAGTGPYTYWLGCDTAQSNWMTSATISQMVREDRNATGTSTTTNRWAYQSSWNFYRISDLTLELFQALYHVKSYVTGGNSDEQYPAEAYLGFLQYAMDAITQYNTHRGTYNIDRSNATRIQLDSMARDLRSYAERLDLEAVPTSYSDIPLEVLDFRADGLLFENYNSGTAYSLSSGSPETVNGVARPGEAKQGDKGGYYLADLIEPQLINDRIVYKEETVNYIAAALAAKHHTFADTSISFTADNMDSYYNTEFMSRVTNNELTDGDFASTLAKTTTPGVNGGILAYSQVETYHDLAYYMLSNLWHETPAEDIVETVTKDGNTYNLPYNMRIDELDTIRLVKNSEGEYVFDSSLGNGRNLAEGIIYTYNDFTANDGRQPALNAASNLGFESSEYFGNNSTGSKTSEPTNSSIFGAHNYGLVYHIDSAFVYYEDKNLFFEFSGDDDVYFFINDRLVCDIGGMHSAVSRTINLNGDIAKSLGLVDGDICSFDMYLAERKTTALNLKFRTNIQLLPASAITEKVQYEYTEAGVIGTELREGVVVRDNTEVGYGLKLLNRSQHGVTELTFKDESLGVQLSKDAVELGTTANAEDLIFLYSTYDTAAGALCTGTPTAVDYDTFYQTLATAIDDLSTVMPLQSGVYQLSGLTEKQIKSLMALGLPASVQLAVYGFHRTVLLSVGEYINVAYTTCRPISGKNEDGSYAYGTTITGAAQRQLYVRELDTVTAQPLSVAIDYGKPVKFDMEDILNCLTYNSLDATVSFLGIHSNAVHGNISLRAPGNLRLTDEEDVLGTDGGTYVRMGDSFRFTPTGIMEGIDSVCAAFYIKDIYSAEYYLMVGINMVPATAVYYEAETLAEDGALSFTELANGAVSNEITTVTDGINDEKEISVENYDPTYDENVVFFGFDKTDSDATRYTQNSVYGGTNFDWASSWTSPSYGIVGGCGVWDGALQIKTQNTGGTWCQFWSIDKLNYAPSADDYVEVRMKIVSASANNGSTISFTPEFFAIAGNDHLRTRPSIAIPVSNVGQGYFVLKFPIYTANAWPSTFQYTDITKLCSISMSFEGITTSTVFNVCIDYFYLGPEETCPSNLNSDSLYFGFDNTVADRYRYLNPIYGSSNFDDASSWQYSAEALSAADGAMTVTANTSGETYVQSAQTLNFPVSRAECAQVKLKFSGMAPTGTDAPVARLDLVLDDGSSYGYDWPVTEEQLASGESITLTADITELLSEHVAKRISSVRLTVLNASGGTVTVDEIYVGAGITQRSDVYIAAPESEAATNPTKELYSPSYDDNVLYFGFDNTEYDQARYQYNTVYGNNNTLTYNYDLLANWNITNYSSTLSGQSISNGTLNFSVAPDNTWCCFGTGATNSTFPLNYTPSQDDWFEIRMSISGASGTATGLDVEMWNSSNQRIKCNHSFGGAKGGTGYFVTSFHLASASVNAGQTDVAYTALGTLKDLRILPVGLATKTKVAFSIDYIYIGPKESRPSEQNQDHLYFGYENDEAAQYKYASHLYGGINYDVSSNYVPSVASEALATSAAINAGALVLTASAGSSNHVWFDTSNGSLLHYDPSNAEIIQVRFKMEDFVLADGATEAFFKLQYFVNGTHKDGPQASFPASYLSSGKYITLTIDVSEHAFSAEEVISRLRVMFGDLQPGSGGTGKVTIDYLYIGPALEAPETETTRDDVYGYDAIYDNDLVYSDHETIFAEGKGVAKMSYKTDENGAYVLDDAGNKILIVNYDSVTPYTEAKFTFTGTGFDIISRTGVDQGGLRVVVCDSNGYVKKTISVVNKGIKELYQIPVVSVEGLDYGTYTVCIFVNAAYDYNNDGDGDIYDGALDRGGEFYFDAVRIYNPINTDTTDEDSAYASALYQAHGEAKPNFKELRGILIDASKDTSSETMEGVLYLDTKSGETNKIAEYTSLGPNNEVYLAAGNAIAFKIEVEGTLPASIDIGAKSADGSTVGMTASVGTSVSSTASSGDWSIATATALYYPLEIDDSLWQTSGSKSYVYVTIANSGENGILSITDIKYAYDGAAAGKARSVRFIVDPEMMESLTTSCEHAYTYTDNGEDHTITCANCDYNATEAHNYVDGTCICGAVEVVEPKYEPKDSLKFTMSISVGAEMTVSYNIMGAAVNSYKDFYLEVKKDVAGGEPVTTVYGITADREAMTAKLNPSTGEAVMYQVTYKGINAKEMGDNFSTTLYAVGEDGTIYYGETVVDSIKSFLVGKIDAAASIPELKTMAVDMLKYGAAAQVRLGYNTENLVTADLTEEQLSYATQELPEAVDYAAATGEGANMNTNIMVTSRVQLNLSCIYTTATAPETIKCVITDSEGKVLAEVAATNKNNVMFTAIYENVGAKEMRDVINATFYEGETAISKTVSWSVESYVAQVRAKTDVAEDELNMVNAMLTYGDSTAAYMTASGQ